MKNTSSTGTTRSLFPLPTTRTRRSPMSTSARRNDRTSAIGASSAMSLHPEPDSLADTGARPTPGPVNRQELLRDVYAATGTAHARRRLVVFLQWCADAEVPEVTRLARTIDRWSNEVLAYHSTGRASNGRVENVHMLTEKIRRNSHGFTNIANYRRRILGLRRVHERSCFRPTLREGRCDVVPLGRDGVSVDAGEHGAEQRRDHVLVRLGD